VKKLPAPLPLRECNANLLWVNIPRHRASSDVRPDADLPFSLTPFCTYSVFETKFVSQENENTIIETSPVRGCKDPCPWSRANCRWWNLETRRPPIALCESAQASSLGTLHDLKREKDFSCPLGFGAWVFVSPPANSFQSLFTSVTHYFAFAIQIFPAWARSPDSA